MTIPVKTPKVAISDLKLEAVVIPVADVDRAKQFYEKLGWGPGGHVSGLDPERKSYASLATFADPDNNLWLLQEVTRRLPGRVNPDKTEFNSAAELAAALRRAAVAHGEHERRTGEHDEAWADWYAEYVVREQVGKQLPK